MPALSLVLGALVLLPAATGQLLRPYKWELLLPTFVALAAVAAFLLMVAVLVAGLNSSPKPAQIIRGIGSFLGLASLALLVAFIAANLCDSLFAMPRVLNIKFAPVPLIAGKTAEADVEVLNKSGKPLHYQWRFNGQAVPGMHTAYFRLPDAPGQYPVEVAIRLNSDIGVVDTAASASGDVQVSFFKTMVDVLADSATPPPPPIVVNCCRGGPACEKRQQKTPPRKKHPTSNQAACPPGH